MSETENKPGLGLNDMALMAQILQVVTERGAIKAGEMEVVGNLYNRIAAFVEANRPVQPEESAEASAEEVATAEPEAVNQ